MTNLTVRTVAKDKSFPIFFGFIQNPKMSPISKVPAILEGNAPERN